MRFNSVPTSLCNSARINDMRNWRKWEEVPQTLETSANVTFTSVRQLISPSPQSGSKYHLHLSQAANLQKHVEVIVKYLNSTLVYIAYSVFSYTDCECHVTCSVTVTHFVCIVDAPLIVRDADDDYDVGDGPPVSKSHC